MLIPVIKRNSEGKFIESKDSLHPKTIGLRVSKSRVKRLQKIVELTGKSQSELAREAFHRFIDEFPLENK